MTNISDILMFNLSLEMAMLDTRMPNGDKMMNTNHDGGAT